MVWVNLTTAVVGVSLIAGGDEAWQGWPVFSLQVGLSLVAAELSYCYIEHPARRAINRRL